jgi:hypothetical protein
MADSSSNREPLEELAESFLARFRAGERPSLTEMIAAHPELADKIRDLFPALIEIEQAGTTPGWAEPRANAGGTALESLADHRIIPEVGRRGMGAVNEAARAALARRATGGRRCRRISLFPVHDPPARADNTSAGRGLDPLRAGASTPQPPLRRGETGGGLPFFSPLPLRRGGSRGGSLAAMQCGREAL